MNASNTILTPSCPIELIWPDIAAQREPKYLPIAQSHTE